MQKIYSTNVVELGPLVTDFMGEKMVILFNENAPAELRDYCVLHRDGNLTDIVAAGDTLRYAGEDFKIVFVGSEVQKNLKDLGHITLRFNGNADGESLEGSLYVEDKPIPSIQVGDTVEIYK
ncbi:PTS glucitol/sorbitol transporter subunit IIA [Selenomonas sp. TAMA-11512]|uniref:PTS glucitol/sorbitol transporter subunit IIA n=1 Tax=Selenomonas sp. TAMA-11512 TaxID=3095337 RepID=UPI0030865BF8|nr:PTS glucitol/sorbitol transporter subunit IIA [Selenomonas sp. TAMA-11512]